MRKSPQDTFLDSRMINAVTIEEACSNSRNNRAGLTHEKRSLIKRWHKLPLTQNWNWFACAVEIICVWNAPIGEIRYPGTNGSIYAAAGWLGQLPLFHTHCPTAITNSTNNICAQHFYINVPPSENQRNPKTQRKCRRASAGVKFSRERGRERRECECRIPCRTR